MGFLVVGVESGPTDGTPLAGLRGIHADVRRVEVILRSVADDPATERRVTVQGTPASVELLGLDERIPRVIGRFVVPAGFVTQIRLVTQGEHAVVLNIAGTQSGAKLPSGPQTGLKIEPLDGVPFEVRAGKTTGVKVLLEPARQVLHNDGIGFLIHPTIPAVAVDPDTLTSFVDGQAIVRFRDGVGLDRQAELIAAFGATVLRHDPPTNYYLLDLPDDKTVRQALEFYLAESDVKYALPNFFIRPRFTPDDPSFTSQPPLAVAQLPEAWDLLTPGQRGDFRVVVAIADTGMDLDHRDLLDNLWINEGELPAALRHTAPGGGADFDGDGVVTFVDLNNPPNDAARALLAAHGVVDRSATIMKGLPGVIDGYDLIEAVNTVFPDLDGDGRQDDDASGKPNDIVGWDFIDDDNDPSDPIPHQVDLDGDGVVDVEVSHGLAVAGVAAATTNNGYAVASPVFRVRVLPIRMIEADADVGVEALQYATRNAGAFGVDVINGSWGATFVRDDLPESERTCLVDQVFATVLDADKFDTSIDKLQGLWNDVVFGQVVFVTSMVNCPVNTDDPRIFEAPGEMLSPTMIRVTSSSLANEIHTSYGPQTTDIAAPAMSAAEDPPNALLTPDQGVLVTDAFGRGTSMAAPLVSGVAALLLASGVVPRGDAIALKNRILDSAVQIDALRDKVANGRVLNARCAIVPGGVGCP